MTFKKKLYAMEILTQHYAILIFLNFPLNLSKFVIHKIFSKMMCNLISLDDVREIPDDKIS